MPARLIAHGAPETRSLGYSTIGWARTPTVPGEGRRRTLKAIHSPLIGVLMYRTGGFAAWRT
jgi:hypothetical protein